MSYMTVEAYVPDWVNWMAQDSHGSWYGYPSKPILAKQVPGSFGPGSRNLWWTSESGEMELIYEGEANKNWKDTLYEVTHE